MGRRPAILARLAGLLFVVCLLLRGAPVEAQQANDPRIADIVSTGKLRVGIGLANLVSGVKDPGTGELRGVATDLGRVLAERMRIQFDPVEYPRPGLVLDGAKSGAWDVAFLVIDPARAADADFSAPYMGSDFTLLAPAGSPIRAFADADRPGIRIGVPRGDAVDLRLTRILKNAELVRVDNQAAGADLLRTGRVDAYGAPRPALMEMSDRLPGAEVLKDSFATIWFAAFVPKGHDEHLAYIGEFLEDAKASQLLKTFMERSNLRGMTAAPPAQAQ